MDVISFHGLIWGVELKNAISVDVHMDVLSHWLWGVLATRKRVHWKISGPMGVLPDLLAFVPSAIYSLMYGIERTSVDDTTLTSDFPAIAWDIYQFSHSAVIVTLAFLLSYLLFKRFSGSKFEQHFEEESRGNALKLAMWLWLPWYIHILLDIPTHTLDFFPTPVLFPLSDAMYDGVRWSNPIVWFSNIGALGLLWTIILVRERRQKNESNA